MRGALLRRTLSGEENMNVNKPPLTGGFMSGLRGKKAPSSKDVVLEASVSTAPTAAAAATSSQLPPSRSSSFDSTDGKIRSRVRATTPGAVAQALNHNGSETPPLSRTNTADSASSQNDGKPRGRARATTPGAVRSQNDNTTMNSNNNVSEPSWGASVHGSTPIKRSINARSASPVFHRKLPANNNNNNKEEEAQAIRQKQIQEIMKDTSLTQTEKQKQIQELMASGMPTSKADISRSDDERIEGNASTRSLGTEPPAANTNTTTATTTTAEEDPQTIRRKQIQEIMRDTTLSQREKQVRMQELMAGGMPKRAAMTSSAQNGAPSYHQRSRPGDDLGSSLHSRSSETDVEDAHTNAAGSGIGGAPQGKMRRITAAARPGAVSVPATREEAEGSDNTTRNLSATSREDNNNSNVNCRVSRRERIRDVNPAPAKTTTATDASPSIGVGGAPQGKMRRTGTVDTTQKPGAVSVAPPSEPTTVQTAETAATTTTTTTTTTTGVGGAPQGKVRRAVTTPASSPGAVRVAPSEPGETTTTTSSSSTAAAGDNFRRTATEPASSAGAATGVGGAPQGKFCRNTNNVSAQPGAVSVVEPTVPSEPRTRSGTSSSNAATPAGLGGAPQGKVRRTTATATTQPGAVSVTEPSNAASLDSHSSHSTEIGGVPQGKIRRTNIAASPQPGAVSSESSASKAQPGDEMALSSHHGMRRAATADLTTTTGSSTGVGGAPQGKMRRATASTPGAVSVVEQNNESGQGTGVGGAPQGKMRRGNAQSTVRRDAPSAQEPSIGSALNAPPQEPSSLVPAVSARSTESSQDNALPNAASSVERDTIAKSSVRRTRPATVTPGAQAVTAPSVAEPEQVDNDTTNAIVSSVERDMLAKSGARRSRMSATAPIRPGAQSVATPDPDDPSANEASQAERDLTSKTRARSNVANRGLGRDSGSGAVSDDLNDQGIDDAAQVVERDLLAKNQSRSSRATAPGARSIPRSPANREPSSPTRVAPDNDLNEAVRAVENDLQSKIQARRGRGGQPVAPGARPVDSQEAAEMDSVISRKDPRASAHYSENPAEDGSIQTNQIEIGAQSSANQPTTVGNRMEQKVLQMEQEQQARDQKLEEIEEMNLRRVGPERSKDFASPSPDTDGPGGDDIENGFLNPDPEAIRQAEEDGLAIAVAIEEDEEPDVYDVELKMYDPDSKPPFHNNRRFRFYSCCICLLALVGIITAAVLVSSNNGGGTKILYETEAPSAAPTQGPTTSRDFAVQSEIARVVGDVVKEPGSVYDEALEWILYEDPMQLDEFSENLIQRYILVLFYLKTSGANRDSWISCNPPQEGENSSCTFYENLMDPQTFEEYWEPREELETRWLSEKHECEWAEVTCHPVSDGNVIAIDIRTYLLLYQVVCWLRFWSSI